MNTPRILPHLLNGWETTSRLGTSAKQNYPMRRRVVMVNQSATLGALISLFYGLLTLGYAPIDLWPMLAATPILVIGYLGVLWLNNRGQALAARLLIVVVPTLQLIFAARLFGSGAGIQLYFFVLWTSMFLLYSQQDRWLSVTSGIGWILLFLWVQLGWDQPSLSAVRNDSGFLSLLATVNAIGVFGLVGVIVALFYLQINRTEAMLQREYRRSEGLLKNILPASVAERLKNGSETIADNFSDVTLLFADIVGFTRLAENLPPDEVVNLLNRVFSRFDQVVQQYGLEKIKTIGDEYMLAGGIPLAREDHAQVVAKAALQMLEVLEELNETLTQPLALRVGIHTGEVVAGVIGSRKFSYDVWGDTVNIASRMQSQGLPGRIQITEATYEKLNGTFECERRGTVRIRGKGRMPTWFLVSSTPENLAQGE